MARPSQRSEASDTGRLGYREPHEAPDERPVIARSPFWASESERLTYEHAVESWPKKKDEGGGTYIVRIAEKVRGRLVGVKSMPDVDREEWYQK